MSARLAAMQSPRRRGSLYLRIVEWSFAFFSATRFLSYLPTLWAIRTVEDSSQYSLITWLCWFGANMSMALWAYEHNGRHFNAAIAVSLSNALMCLLTCVVICAYRL